MGDRCGVAACGGAAATTAIAASRVGSSSSAARSNTRAVQEAVGGYECTGDVQRCPLVLQVLGEELKGMVAEGLLSHEAAERIFDSSWQAYASEQHESKPLHDIRGRVKGYRNNRGDWMLALEDAEVSWTKGLFEEQRVRTVDSKRPPKRRGEELRGAVLRLGTLRITGSEPPLA